MNKTTLLAVVILLGIIASYRAEALIHDSIWHSLTGIKKPVSTIQITVTKEEYKYLLAKRRQEQKCNCQMHVYGTSWGQKLLLLTP